MKPFVAAFLKLNLPLHMLILNAGIMAPLAWEPSKQGFESMFATNNLGHFLMTELLTPKLEETAKTADVRRDDSTRLGVRMRAARLTMRRPPRAGSDRRPLFGGGAPCAATSTWPSVLCRRRSITRWATTA